MLSREERIFSELLLARGLVAREFIEGFAKKASRGTSERSLAEVLVDSGGLLKAQADEALEEARAIDQALAPHLAGGARLGEFRLIRELGRGGMGIVYEAEQQSLGRRVALKVLPAGAALDERVAIRFLREARAAGRLQHPGIVQVFASGRAEGVLYFAMELVDGRSLAESASEGPMAPDDAASVAAEIARALDHAHQAGLVHRDVKPENILLGADGRARLTDFGLVHESVASSFTLPHHVLGTPAYMAPEQALGGTVDLRSDIYALGAVLYTLLGGKPPYGGDLPSVVLSRVLAGPPPPLLSVKDGIPPSLAAICGRAMARQPQDRYATAAELADDLEAFARGEAPAAIAAPNKSKRIAWIVGVATVAAATLITAIAIRARTFVPDSAPLLPTVEGATIFGRYTLPPPNTYELASFQAEVGVKFRSDACGYVTGIRYFKDRRNTGSHVGHLWTSGGALLASAVFSGETDEGWQESSLTSPVRIAPNTTYVASYTTGADKGYNRQNFAFQTSGIDRPPLHALRAGVDGCNGVFKYGPPRDSGGFPDQCVQESNFFVDVTFRAIDCASTTDPSFVLVNASAGSKRWPALSPDGKLMAYEGCLGDRCESSLQDLATGEIVKLGAARSGPAFAPNGRSIAFGTDKGVEVLDLDGRTIDERTIRSFAAPFSSARPAWSGTSAEIVFGGRDDSGGSASNPGIWIGELASRRVRKLKSMDARALAYSPRGSRIAFVSRAGGAPSVWTIRPDGTDATRLTTDAAAEWSPFWSPDGRRIYFGSERGGAPQLWGVDVDEASGRPVGNPTPALNVVFPTAFYATLSADGGTLAIVSEPDEGRLFRLPFAPVPGTLTWPPVALPRFPGGALYPQPSPDQTLLVYSVARPNQNLAIVAADGSGDPRLLTSDEFADAAPRWSPDGKHIAFHSNRSGHNEVWTIRPDGSDLRRITTTSGEAGYPVWSPDGTRLAYSVDGRGGYVVPVSTGAHEAQPEALPSVGVDKYFEPWSWSPDGKTLAGSADGLGVLLYSIPDRTYRRITDFGGHPVWLADGRRLLFLSNRKIYLIGSDGSGLKELYAAAPASLRPFLGVSADGRSIFTSIDATDQSIWIANFPH